MKRTQSFSFYALLIALLVHLIIILFIMLLPKPTPPIPHKEVRFKLSLSEYPNYQAPIIQKIISNPILHHTQSNRTIHSQIPIFVPLEPTFKSSPPIVEAKPTLTIPVVPIERTPIKKPSGLYDILSKPDDSAENLKSDVKINSKIQQFYGDKLDELSAGELEYLKLNLNEIANTAQKTLNRVGNAKIPKNYYPNSQNQYEFYLYPDGSISEIKFTVNGETSVLDDISRMSIEFSAHKFPRPKEKTLIRFKTIYYTY